VIARLRGELLERELEEVVVEAGGVGYHLYVTLNTLARLGAPGSRVDLYVHTLLREEAITLFGFATPEERDAFRRLIGVSGVGPRMARSLLSAMSPEELGRSIRLGDVRAISRAPGIGKRTAERLVVELKESFPCTAAAAASPARPSAGPAAAAGPAGQQEQIAADLEQALQYMGYRPAQIHKVLRQLEPELLRRPLEELIRASLALLQGKG